MNYRQKLFAFFNQFIPTYSEEGVPNDIEYPWATLPINPAGFDEETSVAVHLHYWTESEAVPNGKAVEIARAIKETGCLKCDEGMMYMTLGVPEWQPVPDATERQHKHRIINLNIRWLLTK